MEGEHHNISSGGGTSQYSARSIDDNDDESPHSGNEMDDSDNQPDDVDMEEEDAEQRGNSQTETSIADPDADAADAVDDSADAEEGAVIVSPYFDDVVSILEFDLVFPTKRFLLSYDSQLFRGVHFRFRVAAGEQSITMGTRNFAG